MEIKGAALQQWRAKEDGSTDERLRSKVQLSEPTSTIVAAA